MTEIKRKLEKKLKEDAKSFRVVTLLGPRQAGKTTLAKKAFPNYAYVSLEDLEFRSLAQNDPKAFLRRFPAPAIYDEIQRVPELLSFIQVQVDETPDRKGQFILTGSHQPLLREVLSQSLAGRTSLLTLYPLSFSEIFAYTDKVKNVEASEWIYRGFMPETFHKHLDPTRAFQAYTQTYVERDVRHLIQLKEQIPFERFLKLIAGRVGQLVNYDTLASDVGVSSKTIREWISVLEASFIVFRLPPYFQSLRKRLVKTPKLYFVDVGLAAYLLGIETAEQVERDPLFGNLFENMVVMELVKALLNQAKPASLYFYRDSHGTEVDVLAQRGRELVPIEIKSSMTFHSSLIKTLEYFGKFVQPGSERGYLIYQGGDGPVSSMCHGLNFRQSSLALGLD